MKGYVFQDVNHAGRYLIGCIIRVYGEPVLVNNVYQDSKIYLEARNFIGGNTFSINIYDENVDFTPVPLGWLNYMPNVIVYTCRLPVRHSKIGLHFDNIGTTPLSPTQLKPGPRNIFASESLHKCIMGDYPSFIEALRLHQSCNGKNYAIAFSRQFALYNGQLLKGNFNSAVGGLNGEKILLQKKFSHLFDKLRENNIPCELQKSGA